MAKLDSSSIDWAALQAAAQEWQGLRDALSETANGVASAAKAHVAMRHERYAGRGLPYAVSVKIYTSGGMPRAVIRAPLGAFLGTNTGERRQTRAWGHETMRLHPATDYVLRDAASLYGAASDIFGG